MICTNCGWDNPDGLNFCQKCNGPLSSVPQRKISVENIMTDETAPQSSINCKKCGYPILAGFDSCPNCGAQVKKAVIARPENDGKSGISNRVGVKTIMFDVGKAENAPVQRSSFEKLTVADDARFSKAQSSSGRKGNKATRIDNPIPTVSEPAVSHIASPELHLHKLDVLGIEKNEVTISAQNLVLDNAVFELKDGKWFVQDNSTEGRVYVQATGPIPVASDSVIIIDGAKYRIS